MLALQGDVREHLAALTVAGAAGIAVRRPAELADLDGIVIPGGESTTIGKLAQTFGIFEPLRERIRDGLAAFGSCAGMIMLADRLVDGPADQLTFGGLDVSVRRNAFGRQVDSFEGDLDMVGVGRVHGVFIRAPWVESAGAQVQVLARVPVGGEPVGGEPAGGVSAGGEPAGGVPAGGQPAGDPAAARAGGSDPLGRIVAVRQGSLLATSFHPELSGDARVHRYFVEIVKGLSRQ
ncbi:MAG: pyridoxal 5'-phosphate synthase glutaminase subunit PdxT [Mycobacteriales bacterium]